jgi:hypothetical protein
MSRRRPLRRSRRRTWIWTAPVGAVVVARALALLTSRPHSAAARVPRGPRTIVLILENRGYGQIIGNPAAP